MSTSSVTVQPSEKLIKNPYTFWLTLDVIDIAF